MKHHKLFSNRSNLYAKVRPRYPQELFTFLASLCDDGQSAWDVACGNGQAAVDLAEHFDEVYATDVSEEQIAHAHKNPKVKYSVQPAEGTNFAENQFDLVGVAQALHWFDYDLFWDEVKRVLKPDGIFAAWGYSWFSINPVVDKAFRENFLPPIEPYWAEQNKLLWNEYRDVPIPFEKVGTPKIEMSMTWTLDELFTYLQTWSAVREYIKENGDEFLVRTYESMLPAWGDPSKRKRIPMNFVLLVGRNT